MSRDKQQLQVSPNTYHPHARKGYGRSHHSTKNTERCAYSKQKYFQQNITKQTPWKHLVVHLQGGSSVSIPLSLLGSGKSAKNDDARQLLAGASASPAGFPQPFWRAEHEQVRVLPARWGVCAISDFTLEDYADPLSSPLLHLPASLWYKVDCTVPNMNFCTLEVKLIHRTRNLFLTVSRLTAFCS